MALALALLLPLTVAGQEEPAGTTSLTGEVVRGAVSVAGVEVELHRASATGSEVLAQAVSAADGGFTFGLPPLASHGEDGELLVAAVRHQGVLYAGPAITGPEVLTAPYRIEIYDAVPVPPGGAPVEVAFRYLVSEPTDGGIVVTDLFELSHGQDHAWAPDPRTGVTWHHPLPAEATNIRLGRDPEAGTGVRVGAGGVQVVDPIPPGRRQVLLQYDLPALEGISVPVATAVTDLQLLVLEPAPALEFSGLGVDGTVSTEEGRQYRRFVGSAAAGDVIRAQVAPEPLEVPGPAVALALAMTLATAGIVLPGMRAGDPPSMVTRRHLVLQIARLDLLLEDTPNPVDRRRMLSEREAILDRLREKNRG